MASSLHEMMFGNGSPDDERPKLAPDIEVIRLRDSYAAFNTRHTFVPGMIVRQKPLAPIYTSFGDNGLAIVIEVLIEPVFDTQHSSASPYFRKRLDMIVASIEDGRDFCPFHVDSWHFEPVDDLTLGALAT